MKLKARRDFICLIRSASLVAIHTFTPRNLSQFVEAGVFTDQLLVHFETNQ